MTGAPAPRVSPGHVSQRGLMRAWTVSVSWGELAGFCVPALVGGLLREAPPLLVLGAMVLAGTVEGIVLGWSQARVLRSRLDGFSTTRWVTATAFAAAVAWLAGMSASTFYDTWSTWPTAVVILAFAGWASLLLTSIGVGQWFELRRHTPHAARWIAYTAAGWGAGLTLFTVVTTPLWQPGQQTSTIVAVGVLGGALMALSMALVTGGGMRRLLAVSGRGVPVAEDGHIATDVTTSTTAVVPPRSAPAAPAAQDCEGSRSGELASLGGSTNR